MLAEVADGKLTVDMVADPVKGSLAVIQAVGAEGERRDVEAAIRERMKPFPIAYTVQWTRSLIAGFDRMIFPDTVNPDHPATRAIRGNPWQDPSSSPAP